MDPKVISIKIQAGEKPMILHFSTYLPATALFTLSMEIYGYFPLIYRYNLIFLVLFTDVIVFQHIVYAFSGFHGSSTL